MWRCSPAVKRLAVNGRDRGTSQLIVGFCTPHIACVFQSNMRQSGRYGVCARGHKRSDTEVTVYCVVVSQSGDL